MLRPFDGVEIDALLYKFPQRAELSQESYTSPDCLQNVIDFAFGSESANAKSDRAVS